MVHSRKAQTMKWFTSDTHFGHDKFLEFTPEAPKNYQNVVTDNFLRVMEPGDTLYHLGDMAWNKTAARQFVTTMHDYGVELVWIRGNHDHRCTYGRMNLPVVRWLDVENAPAGGIWLSHYPHMAWPKSFHGSIHLFGHVHGRCGKMPPFGRLMDVGVMNWDYHPVSLDTIMEVMSTRESAPI
jgi:calcineurin-like phosphoesterase family protein